MAYDQSMLRLVNTQSKRRAYKLYLYTTSDAMQDVLTSGYFSPNPGVNLEEGDIIHAQASDGSSFLKVTSDVATVAQSALVNPGGSIVQSVQTLAFNAASPLTGSQRSTWPVDTTAGAVTATLTGSFTPGDTVKFIDYASNFLTSNFTVDFGAHNFRSAASQTQVHGVNDVVPGYEYIDATYGFAEISI